MGAPSRLGLIVIAGALSSGAWASGCFLEPFDMEGHACTTQADCIPGYRCELSVCVAGEPLDTGTDADLDASTPPDAPADAHVTPDATLDAGLDATIAIDAFMGTETGLFDTPMSIEAGMDAPMGPDGSLDDADLREAGPIDAFESVGDGSIGPDADQDAPITPDAAPPTGDVGTDARP